MRKISNEVFYAEGDVIVIDANALRPAINAACVGERRIARLCTHAEPVDLLHEMTIINFSNTYIRPHRNKSLAKSYLLLEGEMDVVLFENDGTPTAVIPLGTFSSGKAHYFRLQRTRFHTLVVKSKRVIFQETTTGPFAPGDTEFAPWAPDSKDADAGAAFRNGLLQTISELTPILRSL